MESIQIKENKKSLSIKMKIRTEITEETPGSYSSNAPSLDVWSQGETAEEAEKNLFEAINLLMEVSIERGTFDKWRKKFAKINKKAEKEAQSPKKVVKMVSSPGVVFNIPEKFQQVYC